MQSVAVPALHSAHETSQVTQTPLSAYVPVGHATTHAPECLYGCDAEQVRQSLAVPAEQVAHVSSQARHDRDASA